MTIRGRSARATPLHLGAALLLGGLVFGGPLVAGAPPSTASGPVTTCEGEAATLVGTEGPDTLRGTTGRDVIVALGGDDRVRGRDGRDLVCGGDGDDRLLGGHGRDRLLGERGDDRILTGMTEDVVAWAVGDGADVVVGGAKVGDHLELVGAEGPDSFEVRPTRLAGEPAELVRHQSGGGVRYLHISVVTAWLHQGADTYSIRNPGHPIASHHVHAGPADGAGEDDASDRLRWLGGDGPDDASFVAAGGPGGSVTTGEHHDHWYSLVTTEAADRVIVDGGPGRDSLVYEASDGARRVRLTEDEARRLVVEDTAAEPTDDAAVRQAFVGFERATVTMRSKRDHVDLSDLVTAMRVLVLGGTGADTFLGSAGPDRFNGGAQDDTAHGGPGRDVLLGRANDDELHGDEGADRLNGGTETDGCSAGPGKDTRISCEVEIGPSPRNQ